MKRLVIATFILFAFNIPAYAQMGMTEEQKGEMKSQGMMMGEGMMKEQMPMMQMCMPMMKQMMGHGMMMQEMMQMMMDMMNTQEKMMMGVNPAEKKQMMKDMARMREKMQRMMSMRMSMMTGTDASEEKLKCAEQWLKKAIDLHEVHIKDPKTATEVSQHEMMDQMKNAYECITGAGPEVKIAPAKEPAGGEKKKDAHGH